METLVTVFALVAIVVSAAVVLVGLVQEHDTRVRVEILQLLHQHGESYGLDLVKLSEQSGGRLKRGSIYVHLYELERRGVVSSREERVDLRKRPILAARRLYSLREPSL